MRSMTGFGAAFAPVGDQRYHVQVRSVNHRFLEVRLRTPRELQGLESDLAARVRGRLERGHVEVLVASEDPTGAAGSSRFDAVVAARLVAAARAFGAVHEVRDDLGLAALLSTPGVVISSGDAAPDAGPALLKALDVAVDALIAMRQTEGARLVADLLVRRAALLSIVDGIAARAPAWADERRARLRQRLVELPTGRLDAGALEHEVVATVEKADVAEELVRLRAHLAAMETELKKSDGRGKKLEFLTQELLREFNTVGSKSQDTSITHAVIEAKCEVERIREQVNNLE